MFGLPEWAIGTAFVTLVGCGGLGLLIRLIPPEMRMFGRRRPVLAELAALEQVQHRLDELEHVRTRMTEVEERLDFAERLLAQQREAERLAPPVS